MSKTITIGVMMVVVLAAQACGISSSRQSADATPHLNSVLAAKFEELSTQGNSSCSAAFRDSIPFMSDHRRLRGSCCSVMNPHRYSEQIEGLKQFKSKASQNISEIPDDPYDIESGLAKKLIAYYDLELTSEEQRAYDHTLMNAHEKGPCCCRCWRWYVYGGLAKYLVKNHHFTGEQIT